MSSVPASRPQNQLVRRTAASVTAMIGLLGCTVAVAPTANATPSVAGSTDPAAATLLGLGDSTSNLGNGRDRIDRNRYYRLQPGRPGNALAVGAAMVPPRLGYDGIGLQTRRTQNSSCLNQLNFSSTRGSGVVGVGGLALDGCDQELGVQLQLQRADLDDMPLTTEPAAILIRVIEIPPARNADALPTELPEPGTPADLATDRIDKVAPGTLTEPARIETEHSYRLRLEAGRVHFFSIPVDWGQWLQVQGNIAPSAQVEAMAAQNPQFGITVLGPDLGELEEGLTTLSGTAEKVDVVTDPVVLRSYRSTSTPPYLAGPHLIAVWLSSDGLAGPLTLDYTLTTRVGGVVTGVPDFGEARILGLQGAGPPVRRWVALGFGVLGSGLLVAAGAVWLIRRSMQKSGAI